MKPIKRFENLKEYSIKDFYNIQYWRYRNSKIDTILCVIYPIVKEIIYFEFLKLDDNKFFHMTFKFYQIRELFELEDDIKLFRPASTEEIEKYKLEKDSKKYNL